MFYKNNSVHIKIMYSVVCLCWLVMFSRTACNTLFKKDTRTHHRDVPRGIHIRIRYGCFIYSQPLIRIRLPERLYL